MTISVNPATGVISVPKADLALVSGTLFEHDTEAFRLELIDFEDSELGIVQPQTHLHNTEVTIVGVTYARFIEMLSPYSVEYEDGAYSVRLSGSNNNIFDVEAGILVQNTVQIIANNSAGLIVVTTGSGLDAGQDAKLTSIANETDEMHRDAGLDAANPKTITENTPGESYDEAAGAIDKEVRKVGVTTTITRQ